MSQNEFSMMDNQDISYQEGLSGDWPPDSGSPQDGTDIFEEGGGQDGRQEENAQEEAQESPKRGKRKKKSGDSPALEDDERSGEGETGFYDGDGEPEDSLDEDEGIWDESGGVIPEGSDEQRSVDRRQRGPGTLDSSGNIIYEQGDSGQHDLSILTAARNSRKILSATLDGYEAEGEAMPRGVFYVGTVKVIIPFSEMGFDVPDDIDHVGARLQINMLLGAKIFYMVRGVDVKNRIAGASRRDAMFRRQRSILNSQNAEGEYRIREGVRCTAQMLHISRRFILAEIYGLETVIPIGDISNIWVNDIREVIKVGEERAVSIREVQRDPETGRATSIRASLKLAEEIPQMELETGHIYTGVISGFSDTAYFVNVAGVKKEIRCPINSNYVGELMGRGDYVRFFVRAIYDTGPTGAILKILKKAQS